MKKIAITGLNGVIGRKLLRSSFVPEDIEVVELYHTQPILPSLPFPGSSHQLDLTNLEELHRVLETTSPDCIIHLAGATHIDACQLDADNGEAGQVWRLNVDVPEAIAQYAKTTGAQLVMLSSECVFDGRNSRGARENDVHSPVNWYGTTKAEAEKRVLATLPTASIIRSVIAFDTDVELPTMLRAISQRFKRGRQFSAVNDQWFTPTLVSDIHHAIWKVLEKQERGILHVSPDEPITPYQFALLIGTYFHYNLDLVRGVTLKEYFGPERAALRLRYSVLSGDDTRERLGFTPSPASTVLTRE
jgi:dTDP-4-dehydrorhamnose reductase